MHCFPVGACDPAFDFDGGCLQPSAGANSHAVGDRRGDQPVRRQGRNLDDRRVGAVPCPFVPVPSQPGSEKTQL